MKRNLVVIDEIGKMVFCSGKFKEIVLEIVEDENMVIGVIMSASNKGI